MLVQFCPQAFTNAYICDFKYRAQYIIVKSILWALHGLVKVKVLANSFYLRDPALFKNKTHPIKKDRTQWNSKHAKSQRGRFNLLCVQPLPWHCPVKDPVT